MRIRRTDGNQTEIVETFRALGASVQHLHIVGKGCPDILVGYMGINSLIEIKDGSKPPSKQALTKEEAEWHDSWRGQVAIISTTDQAIEYLRKIKELKNVR